MKHDFQIILIGDSDISRWPPSLYPQCRKICSDICKDGEASVKKLGQSGAVLSDLIPQLRQWRAENPAMQADGSLSERFHVFVACAGENDIGSGRALDSLSETFRSFLDELFPHSQLEQHHNIHHNLIFLGPKFEPWLSTDMSSRKQYTKLSNSLQRTIRKHQGFTTSRIVFVNCLTMFCTSQTATVPGALHDGRAIPDEKYFDDDGLHLNEDGYRVWKNIVEEELNNIFAMEASTC